MLAELQDIVRSARPIVSQSIADATVAGWLGGASAVVVKLPDAPKPPAFAAPPGEPPPRPPFQLKLFPEGDDDSLVKFPGLERAAEQLYDRQIMAPEDFYKLGAKAKQQAFTISGDLEEKSLETLRDLLGETMQKGGNLDTFARAARGAFETLPISDTHLEQVYRNATNEAYSQGMERVLDHPVVSGGFPYRLYVPIHDARARHEHRDLEKLGIDGTAVYHKDDPTWLKFRPPWDWGCVLPGNAVQGKINLAMQSWYEGEAVEIVTRQGNRLTVTINHPVLTDAGFVPAGQLERGQNVLAYRGQVHAGLDANWREELPLGAAGANQPVLSPPSFDVKNRPALIEDVFGAFGKVGERMRVEVAASDLHGEASRGNGYVDVVATQRELLLDIQAGTAHRVGNVGFVPVDRNQPALPSLSDPTALCVAVGDTAGGLPGGSTLTLDELAVALDLRPFGFLRIGSAANIDASRFDYPSYDAAVDPVGLGQALAGRSGLVAGNDLCLVGELHEVGAGHFGSRPDGDLGRNETLPQVFATDAAFAGDLADRTAGDVARDEIIEVRKFNYAGHVYDLQSRGGWIVAGGIFASNCRCGWIALSIKSAAKLGVREAQEWLATGIEPNHPPVTPPPFSPPASWDRAQSAAV